MRNRRGMWVLMLAGLTGCSVFEAGPDQSRLAGERIPVLAYEQRLVAQESLGDLTVTLPPATANADWPQAGGDAAKSPGHVSGPEKPQRQWVRSIGAGQGVGRRLVAGPAVLEGLAYVVDAQGDVTALDAISGAVRWKTRVLRAMEDRQTAFGGGVAAGVGSDGVKRVYVTTGHGLAVALAADTGVELWRFQAQTPLRGAPTLAQGRLFVVTIDNQLFALDALTGVEQWDAMGIAEVAGLLGAGPPAIALDTLVIGFSSGELNAMRLENGRVTWQDSLARTARLTALASLTDIDASPVIDRDLVFAIGHSGRMVALELATGERAWESNIAGLSTPWVVGDFVFVVSVDGELVCLTRREGQVRWVVQLDQYRDKAKKRDLIRWSGPVLASEQLWLASSDGRLSAFSPYTGTPLMTLKLPGGTSQGPVVAGGMLYVLTDNGDLAAYR